MIVSQLVFPSESVAVHVMVWTPGGVSAVVVVSPEPSGAVTRSLRHFVEDLAWIAATLETRITTAKRSAHSTSCSPSGPRP